MKAGLAHYLQVAPNSFKVLEAGQRAKLGVSGDDQVAGNA